MADDPSFTRPPSRLAFRLSVGGLLFALLMLGVGVYFWTSGGGRVAGSQAIGGPFALVDGDGRTVTDRDFRGKYMLVYFGYTFCPDVCPTTLNEVAVAMERLGGKAEQVQPIFITLDPQRDTPAAVKKYANAFSPKLIGLTGTPDAIAKVAREYRVYYAIHSTGSGPDDYTVDHSSILYLLGPDGGFVAPIRADQPGDQMAADIAQHLS